MEIVFSIRDSGIQDSPDKEKRVDWKSSIADCLEHEVPLGHNSQCLVLCR